MFNPHEIVIVNTKLMLRISACSHAMCSSSQLCTYGNGRCEN